RVGIDADVHGGGGRSGIHVERERIGSARGGGGELEGLGLTGRIVISRALDRVGAEQQPAVGGIVDGDSDRARGGGGAGGVTGDRGEGVAAVGGCGGVPTRRVGHGGQFRAEVRAVQFELDTSDTHIIGGRGRHRDGAAERRALAGAGYRNCGRGGVPGNRGVSLIGWSAHVTGRVPGRDQEVIRPRAQTDVGERS